MRIAFVGAGFASSVLARKLAETGQFQIEIFEERQHIAGNCFTERDASTGILVHEYGPHIFNTDREDVWRYVNSLVEFMPFTNRVKAVTAKGIFSLPINLLTINQFFGRQMNPQEAEIFIRMQGDSSIEEPANFEEQALKFVGPEIYQNFFYGYTKKQWGVDPKELPASILKRLPLRFNYDDNYYNKKFQGIPKEGYTPLVQKLLDHPQIETHLKSKFDRNRLRDYAHCFWSGPIDAFFDFKAGRLEYRSLEFERFEIDGDFQGNAVINYCEEKIPYTRITEHKHFAPWEVHQKSIYFKEYSKKTSPQDVPFYPVRLAEDKEKLKDYEKLAQESAGLTFIGRLGTYRYLDMDKTIGESLDLAEKIKNLPYQDWPKFSVDSLTE